MAENRKKREDLHPCRRWESFGGSAKGGAVGLALQRVGEGVDFGASVGILIWNRWIEVGFYNEYLKRMLRSLLKIRSLDGGEECVEKRWQV